MIESPSNEMSLEPEVDYRRDGYCRFVLFHSAAGMVTICYDPPRGFFLVGTSFVNQIDGQSSISRLHDKEKHLATYLEGQI